MAVVSWVDIEGALGSGFITEEKAREVQRRFPECADHLLGWLRGFKGVKDWRRLEKFANLAAILNPEELGSFLTEVLEERPDGVLCEDLVEIVGEIAYEGAVTVVYDLAREGISDSRHFYALTLKCLFALGSIGTEEAVQYLVEFTRDGLPEAVRQAASDELASLRESGD